MEEDFISLNFHHSPGDDMYRLKQSLFDRNLHLADGVLRRHFEETPPSSIQIECLEELEMKEMLEIKQRGNEMFEKGEYEGAIELYEQALFEVCCMFVGPKDQVEQIVAILSNQAECQLSLHLYRDAGETATNALIYMGYHDKYRIRRAKAGLAIGKEKNIIDGAMVLITLFELKRIWKIFCSTPIAL